MWSREAEYPGPVGSGGGERVPNKINECSIWTQIPLVSCRISPCTVYVSYTYVIQCIASKAKSPYGTKKIRVKIKKSNHTLFLFFHWHRPLINVPDTMHCKQQTFFFLSPHLQETRLQINVLQTLKPQSFQLFRKAVVLFTCYDTFPLKTHNSKFHCGFQTVAKYDATGSSVPRRLCERACERLCMCLACALAHTHTLVQTHTHTRAHTPHTPEARRWNTHHRRPNPLTQSSPALHIPQKELHPTPPHPPLLLRPAPNRKLTPFFPPTLWLLKGCTFKLCLQKPTEWESKRAHTNTH